MERSRCTIFYFLREGSVVFQIDGFNNHASILDNHYVSVPLCPLISAHFRGIKPVSAVCLSHLLHVRERTWVVLRLGYHN
ncbi:hypothetical protein T01_5203 [Trichinella spiralis]|uniref:Uncharacterized protein n=1 Tax=Trichinella spiralis TaxID=6334 RepID=A0A0V1B951_TRISP|nr:hypothetical protein T01_5203 [Trichinella spiralis]